MVVVGGRDLIFILFLKYKINLSRTQYEFFQFLICPKTIPKKEKKTKKKKPKANENSNNKSDNNN